VLRHKVQAVAIGLVVLDGSPGGGGPGLGSTLTVTGVPGAPSLTVVGMPDEHGKPDEPSKPDEHRDARRPPSP
jgi:hypothetical protein